MSTTRQHDFNKIDESDDEHNYDSSDGEYITEENYPDSKTLLLAAAGSSLTQLSSEPESSTPPPISPNYYYGNPTPQLSNHHATTFSSAGKIMPSYQMTEPLVINSDEEPSACCNKCTIS